MTPIQVSKQHIKTEAVPPKCDLNTDRKQMRPTFAFLHTRVVETAKIKVAATPLFEAVGT